MQLQFKSIQFDNFYANKIHPDRFERRGDVEEIRQPAWPPSSSICSVLSLAQYGKLGHTASVRVRVHHHSRALGPAIVTRAARAKLCTSSLLSR
eukprot:6187472-Pleurochrysis_carterae.AAC.1